MIDIDDNDSIVCGYSDAAMIAMILVIAMTVLSFW